MGGLTVLAHPLTEPGRLPLPPLVVAALAVLAVVAVGARPTPRAETASAPTTSGQATGRPGWFELGARGLSVGALVLVVVAGRVGNPTVPRNIAPALAVGVGWPLLVAASVVLGPVWRRIDPWDTLARLFVPLSGDRSAGSAGPRHVWWALPGAAAVVWYLSGYRGALLPRSVGAAVAVYTVVTVAGCLVVGRARWLSQAEVIGLFLGWCGRARHGRLRRWEPPAGAATVLGVLGGGLLFGLLRYSEVLDVLIFGVRRLPAETVGVAALSLAGAIVLVAAERAAAHAGARGTAVAAAVPMVAAIAIAGAQVRGQMVSALLLLPRVASDPLGRGWDLFGTADWPVGPNPLGDPLATGLQVAVLVAGGLGGAVIVRRRAVTAAGGLRAVAGVAVLLAGGVLAATVA